MPIEIKHDYPMAYYGNLAYAAGRGQRREYEQQRADQVRSLEANLRASAQRQIQEHQYELLKMRISAEIQSRAQKEAAELGLAKATEEMTLRHQYNVINEEQKNRYVKETAERAFESQKYLHKLDLESKLTAEGWKGLNDYFQNADKLLNDRYPNMVFSPEDDIRRKTLDRKARNILNNESIEMTGKRTALDEILEERDSIVPTVRRIPQEGQPGYVGKDEEGNRYVINGEGIPDYQTELIGRRNAEKAGIEKAALEKFEMEYKQSKEGKDFEQTKEKDERTYNLNLAKMINDDVNAIYTGRMNAKTIDPALPMPDRIAIRREVAADYARQGFVFFTSSAAAYAGQPQFPVAKTEIRSIATIPREEFQKIVSTAKKIRDANKDFSEYGSPENAVIEYLEGQNIDPDEFFTYLRSLLNVSQ